MIYRNTKTGAIVDSSCAISGGDWVPEEPAKIIAAPAIVEELKEEKMLYKNTLTGALLDSPCVISGGNWVALDEEQKLDAAALSQDDVVDPDEDIQLSKMTVKDLRALAAELEIKLGDATKKDDIINVILASEEKE